MLTPGAARSTLTLASSLLALTFAACNRDADPDAYGNFEATETVVSA